MDGGAGTDVADFTLANAGIAADLSAGTAFSIFDGSTDSLLNIENLNGSGFDDALTGNDANAIFGNDGNDTLEGNDGSDTLDGGDGNDSIEGDSGAGNDSLIGGAGADTLGMPVTAPGTTASTAAPIPIRRSSATPG